MGIKLVLEFVDQWSWNNCLWKHIPWVNNLRAKRVTMDKSWITTSIISIDGPLFYGLSSLQIMAHFVWSTRWFREVNLTLLMLPFSSTWNYACLTPGKMTSCMCHSPELKQENSASVQKCQPCITNCHLKWFLLVDGTWHVLKRQMLAQPLNW